MRYHEFGYCRTTRAINFHPIDIGYYLFGATFFERIYYGVGIFFSVQGGTASTHRQLIPPVEEGLSYVDLPLPDVAFQCYRRLE